MITEDNLNLESSESSRNIYHLKVPIEDCNKTIGIEYLDLTKELTTPDLSKAQLEKEFLEELNEIILNQADKTPSDEIFEENTSIFDLCVSTCDLFDLKTKPNSLPDLKSLNQSLLSNRSIFISKEIHETSCFSKDIGTSSPLRTSISIGINNPLVLKNTEDKRIVSRENIVSKPFISKSTKDEPIPNYKLGVLVSKIINRYPRSNLVDSQLTEIFDNLTTIRSTRTLD